MTKLNLYESPESLFIELRSSQLLMASSSLSASGDNVSYTSDSESDFDSIFNQ